MKENSLILLKFLNMLITDNTVSRQLDKYNKWLYAKPKRN